METKKFISYLCLLLFSFCATLPLQTVTLADSIINEGQRMHNLNILLTNKMFQDKREKIDEFIKKEYTPKYMDEFRKKIPAGVDFEKEFPNIIQSIIPEINSRRDIMQSALEDQRIKILTKLDADYKAFEEASFELKNLIESNIKVNEERRKVFEQIKSLTNNNLDFNQVETEIDKFIIKAGDMSGNINDLNSSINSLLNN